MTKDAFVHKCARPFRSLRVTVPESALVTMRDYEIDVRGGASTLEIVSGR